MQKFYWPRRTFAGYQDENTERQRFGLPQSRWLDTQSTTVSTAYQPLSVQVNTAHNAVQVNTAHNAVQVNIAHNAVQMNTAYNGLQVNTPNNAPHAVHNGVQVNTTRHIQVNNAHNLPVSISKSGNPYPLHTSGRHTVVRLGGEQSEQSCVEVTHSAERNTETGEISSTTVRLRQEDRVGRRLDKKHNTWNQNTLSHTEYECRDGQERGK